MGRRKKETVPLEVGAIQYVYSPTSLKKLIRVYVAFIEEELQSQIDRGNDQST